MGIESGGQSFSGGGGKRRRISDGGDCILRSKRRVSAGEMLGVSTRATSRVQAESSLYYFISQGDQFFNFNLYNLNKILHMHIMLFNVIFTHVDYDI